jgi:hypothetical protein
VLFICGKVATVCALINKQVRNPILQLPAFTTGIPAGYNGIMDWGVLTATYFKTILLNKPVPFPLDNYLENKCYTQKNMLQFLRISSRFCEDAIFD